MNKTLLGLAGGSVIGLCLAVPAAIAGWGVVAYYGITLGAAAATSVGVPGFVGGIFGGVVGAAYVGPMAAQLSFYATAGAMAVVGTAVGAVASLAEKTFNFVTGRKPVSKPAKKVQAQISFKQPVNPLSALMKKSLRKSFKDSVSSKQKTDLENSAANRYKGPKGPDSRVK